MSILLTFRALLLIYFHFISLFQSSPSLSSPPRLLLNPEVLKVYTFPEVLRFHGAIFVDYAGHSLTLISLETHDLWI